RYGGIYGRDIVRRSGRRHHRAVQVGREEATVAHAGLEADGRRRLAGEHLRAVEGPGACANKGVALKVVERQVVGVRPDGQLRIIVEVDIADLKGVAVVGAGWVAGRRDRQTLDERGDRIALLIQREGELREDPAVGHSVVAHDG